MLYCYTERWLLFKYREIRFNESDGLGKTNFLKVEFDKERGGDFVFWINIWLAGDKYQNPNYLKGINPMKKNDSDV